MADESLNVSNPLSLRDHARLSKKFFGEFDDLRPSALSRANVKHSPAHAGEPPAPAAAGRQAVGLVL